MNQNKRVETLRNVYQAMDDERRIKMELIAEGLMNIKMLVDEAKIKVQGNEENLVGSNSQYHQICADKREN